MNRESKTRLLHNIKLEKWNAFFKTLLPVKAANPCCRSCSCLWRIRAVGDVWRWKWNSREDLWSRNRKTYYLKHCSFYVWCVDDPWEFIYAELGRGGMSTGCVQFVQEPSLSYFIYFLEYRLRGQMSSFCWVICQNCASLEKKIYLYLLESLEVVIMELRCVEEDCCVKRKFCWNKILVLPPPDSPYLNASLRWQSVSIGIEQPLGPIRQRHCKLGCDHTVNNKFITWSSRICFSLSNR